MAGVAHRLPEHPIDGFSMAFAEVARATVGDQPCAIVGNLVLAGVSSAGNKDAAEVQVEAGLLLHLPGATDEAAAGTLDGDIAGGVFHAGGANTLPIRVGWQMRSYGTPEPKVALIRAEVHPLGRDRWALQFIRETGPSGLSREGTLFASAAKDTFAEVVRVVFCIPWRSPHRELWLPMPVESFDEALRSVVEAALS